MPLTLEDRAEDPSETIRQIPTNGLVFSPPEAKQGYRHEITEYYVTQEDGLEFHVFNDSSSTSSGDPPRLNRMYVYRTSEGPIQPVGPARPPSRVDNSGRTGLDMEVYVRSLMGMRKDRCPTHDARDLLQTAVEIKSLRQDGHFILLQRQHEYLLEANGDYVFVVYGVQGGGSKYTIYDVVRRPAALIESKMDLRWIRTIHEDMGLVYRSYVNSKWITGMG